MKSKTFRIIVLVVGLVGIAVCCVLGFSKIACLHTFTEWEITIAPTCTDQGRFSKVCKHCGKETEYRTIAATGHTGEWTVEHSCGYTEGLRYRNCTQCGIYQEETIPAGHYWEDGVCIYCGAIRETYYKKFGSYPQTEVTDEELIAELDMQVLAEEITASFAEESTPAIRNTMENGSQYVDVEYEGAKYRGVCTAKADEFCYSFTWFKYEPLIWEVLKENEDTYILWCTNAIDCMAFSTRDAIAFPESTLYSWLHQVFLWDAFTEEEFNSIDASFLDGEEYNPCFVYILSEEDLASGYYGFMPEGSKYDERRFRLLTDYAIYTGAYADTRDGVSFGLYWTRDVYEDGSQIGICVNGVTSIVSDAEQEGFCVVPAIEVKKSYFDE